MRKRWYDSDPTLSMAISLLENTQVEYREQTRIHILNRIQSLDARILEEVKAEPSGFWAMIQKRQTLNEETWRLIEMFKYLTEEDRRELAVEMIRMVYCLETNKEGDFSLDLPDNFRAAV